MTSRISWQRSRRCCWRRTGSEQFWGKTERCSSWTVHPKQLTAKPTNTNCITNYVTKYHAREFAWQPCWTGTIQFLFSGNEIYFHTKKVFIVPLYLFPHPSNKLQVILPLSLTPFKMQEKSHFHISMIHAFNYRVTYKSFWSIHSFDLYHVIMLGGGGRGLGDIWARRANN